MATIAAMHSKSSAGFRATRFRAVRRATRWRSLTPRRGRKGWKGLRVVNSSIMPSITSGHLNAPVGVAEGWRERRRQGVRSRQALEAIAGSAGSKAGQGRQIFATCKSLSYR